MCAVEKIGKGALRVPLSLLFLLHMGGMMGCRPTTECLLSQFHPSTFLPSLFSFYSVEV